MPGFFAGTFFEGAWPMIVGHRGVAARRPENGLAGVLSGLEAVGAVEVDVRLSGDGHLVLSHDPEVAGLVVSTTSASRLLAAQPCLCLLDEIIAIPGRIDLEVKNTPGEEGFDPSGTAALLTAARGRPMDVLTSFYWPDMDTVRSRNVQSATGLVVGPGGSVEDCLTHAVEHGHRAISVHDSLVSDAVCSEAARLGVAVMVWTVNVIDRARELSGMGVAAIISDDPLLIRTGLRE